MARPKKPFYVKAGTGSQKGKIKVVVNHHNIQRSRWIDESGDIEETKKQLIEKIEQHTGGQTDPKAIKIATSVRNLYNHPKPLGWLGLKPSAMRDSRVDALVSYFGKDTPIKNITSKDLKHYIDKRLAEGFGSASLNFDISILSKLFRFALDREYITQQVMIPKFFKAAERKRRTMTVEETQGMIDYFRHLGTHPELYPVFILLRYTGLRWPELCNIHFNDLDLSPDEYPGCIYIKGDKYGTKNKVTRTVYLNNVAREALDNYITSFLDVSSLKENCKLFTINKMFFYRAFEKAKASLGLEDDKGLVVYSLRHTYATELAENGASAFIIKSAMGHKNINTTMKYIHMGQDHKDNMREINERIAKRHQSIMVSSSDDNTIKQVMNMNNSGETNNDNSKRNINT